jgi:hypothetical protein
MKYINLLIFSFLLSCVAEDIRHEGVIEKEKMINILKEVFVLETYYQSTYGPINGMKNALDSSASIVLKKFGVTKADFESSFVHYSKNLSEFQEMQTKIMERLEKKAN